MRGVSLDLQEAGALTKDIGFFWVCVLPEHKEEQVKEKRLLYSRTNGVSRGQDVNIECLNLAIPNVKPTSLSGIIKTSYSIEVYDYSGYQRPRWAEGLGVNPFVPSGTQVNNLSVFVIFTGPCIQFISIHPIT